MLVQKKLALIAGIGDLPKLIIHSYRAHNIPLLVICFKESMDDELYRISDRCFSIGEVGKLFQYLKQESCDQIGFAGIIREPNYVRLRFDFTGFLHLAGIIFASLKGDDALLRHVIRGFEKRGFHYIEQSVLGKDLLASAGALGKYMYSKRDISDIQLALKKAFEIGIQDIGQAVIIRDHKVIAQEDHKGTDIMLDRLIDQQKSDPGLHIAPNAPRSGVLLKILKPNQDRRIDLPTIGPDTVKKAAIAGLSGILVEAGHAFILHSKQVKSLADEKGLYIVGINRREFDTDLV